MKLNQDQIRKLAQATVETRPEEIDCDQWLDKVAGYVEAVANGQPVPSEYQPVADHLAVCPECSEEFDAMIELLKPDADR